MVAGRRAVYHGIDVVFGKFAIDTYERAVGAVGAEHHEAAYGRVLVHAGEHTHLVAVTVDGYQVVIAVGVEGPRCVG